MKYCEYPYLDRPCELPALCRVWCHTETKGEPVTAGFFWMCSSHADKVASSYNVSVEAIK